MLKKMAAMSPDLLRVYCVQAKRVLFLDGMVRILETFTDYGDVALCSSDSNHQALDERPGEQSDQEPRSVRLVMSVLRAIPDDLVKSRYLPHLSTWFEGFSTGNGYGGGTQRQAEQKLWVGVYQRQLESFLHQRVANSENLPGSNKEDRIDMPDRRGGEGRSLCLLGLVLSERLSLRHDREQVQGDECAIESRTLFYGLVCCRLVIV